MISWILYWNHPTACLLTKSTSVFEASWLLKGSGPMRLPGSSFIFFRKPVSLFCSEGETLRKEGSSGSAGLCSLTHSHLRWKLTLASHSRVTASRVMHHGYLNFKALAQCATKKKKPRTFENSRILFRYPGKTLKISGMMFVLNWQASKYSLRTRAMQCWPVVIGDSWDI